MKHYEKVEAERQLMETMRELVDKYEDEEDYLSASERKYLEKQKRLLRATKVDK